LLVGDSLLLYRTDRTFFPEGETENGVLTIGSCASGANCDRSITPRSGHLCGLASSGTQPSDLRDHPLCYESAMTGLSGPVSCTLVYELVRN
jgi:hypothetical protein